MSAGDLLDSKTKPQMLSKLDCILFDVDGVLVDIRKSYNIAIKKTVDFVLKQLSGRDDTNGLVTDELILKFRQTGGFNNDTDTSYAIILSALAFSKAENLASISKMRKFLNRVAENADEAGITSVEKFLSFSGYAIDEFKDILSYPGPISQSLVGRVFDEIFYGPKIFKERSRLDPAYYNGRPMIENDRLAVSQKTIEHLSETFGGKLAIVSGRSKLAAEYSLKPVFGYFQLDACVFLEDEKRKYAKPNPYAVKKAMAAMGANSALYVGDSTEDLLMARRAEKETGCKITFVGVYGCSPEPRKTAARLKKTGADFIARDVNQLSVMLRKFR
jgi:HAD superfamily phosphatase